MFPFIFHPVPRKSGTVRPAPIQEAIDNGKLDKASIREIDEIIEEVNQPNNPLANKAQERLDEIVRYVYPLGWRGSVSRARRLLESDRYLQGRAMSRAAKDETDKAKQRELDKAIQRALAPAKPFFGTNITSRRNLVTRANVKAQEEAERRRREQRRAQFPETTFDREQRESRERRDRISKSAGGGGKSLEDRRDALARKFGGLCAGRNPHHYWFCTDEGTQRQREREQQISRLADISAGIRPPRRATTPGGLTPPIPRRA